MGWSISAVIGILAFSFTLQNFFDARHAPIAVVEAVDDNKLVIAGIIKDRQKQSYREDVSYWEKEEFKFKREHGSDEYKWTDEEAKEWMAIQLKLREKQRLLDDLK